MKYVVCLLLLLAPVTVAAQGEGWSTPHRIDTPTRSNWFPNLAVDPWGGVHLLWSSGKGSGKDTEDLLMYSELKNGIWSAANDIVRTGVGGWAVRSSVTVDRSGQLHALVRSRDSIFYTSAFAPDAWSAQKWRPLHKINGLNQPYYSAIAIDGSGVLHAVWSELAPKINDQSCDSCSDLWYRRSFDNGVTWSAPINISRGQSGSIKPQLVLSDDDDLYVAWDDGKDPNATLGQPIGIAFTASHDHGKTWEPAQRMALPDSALEQSTLGIDGSGTLLLLFRATATNDILFRASEDRGASWTDPAPVPGLFARDHNDTPWDKYTMARDGDGNLHALLVARRNAAAPVPGLFHVVWNHERNHWGEPELVTSGERYPEWPQLVIANGNQLHATWFTRNERDRHDSDNAAYQVWYSTRQVDAAAAPVMIVPTATPRPTATAVPEVIETRSEITLDQRARLAPQATSVKSEVPLLRYLLWALVPSIGFLLLVILFAMQRRLAGQQHLVSRKNT